MFAIMKNVMSRINRGHCNSSASLENQEIICVSLSIYTQTLKRIQRSIPPSRIASSYLSRNSPSIHFYRFRQHHAPKKSNAEFLFGNDTQPRNFKEVTKFL